MAKSGLKATGSVYGYERNENKSLKVVKSESMVVSKIFQLYSEHKSLVTVAESLNRQKNRMGTKSTHKSIVSTRMLNPYNHMLIE